MRKDELLTLAEPLISKTQFQYIKSIEEKQLFLMELLENKNDQAILDEIKFQDEDESGKNITQIYSELSDNGKLYRQLPRYQFLYDFLKPWVRDDSLKSFMIKSLPDTFDQFTLPQFLLTGGVITDKSDDEYNFITAIELENMCFTEKNFFVKVTGVGSSFSERANYWIKTGPILYSLDMGGKMSFDLSLSYLDYSKRIKTTLFGLKQARHPYDGALANLFIPLDFTRLGSATRVGMTADRGLVKAIENSGIKKVSFSLRTLLFKIGNNQFSDPQSDLVQLKHHINHYDQTCETLRYLLGPKSVSQNRITSEFSKGDFNRSTFRPEYKQESEVAYKILHIFETSRGISDHQLKKIFYDYFNEEKIASLDASLFIRDMYRVTLKKNCYGLYVLFIQRELQECLEMAWQDYQISHQQSPHIEVLLDDAMLLEICQNLIKTPLKTKVAMAELLKERGWFSDMKIIGQREKIVEEFKDLNMLGCMRKKFRVEDACANFFEIHISDFEKLCQLLGNKNSLSILPKGFAIAHNHRFESLLYLMRSAAPSSSYDCYNHLHNELRRMSRYLPRSSSSLAYQDEPLPDFFEVYSSSSSSSSSSSFSSSMFAPKKIMKMDEKQSKDHPYSSTTSTLVETSTTSTPVEKVVEEIAIDIKPVVKEELRLSAIDHFTGVGSDRDLRKFESWYSTEAIESIIFHGDSPAAGCPMYRSVFYSVDKYNEGGVDFTIQFNALVRLKKLCDAPYASFITFEPGQINTSHFNFGIMWDGVLLLIDPTGKELSTGLAKILAQLQRKHTLEVILSSTQLQRDRAGLVSCGPLCVELMRHFQKQTLDSIKRKLSPKLLVSRSKQVDLDEGELKTFRYTTLDLFETKLLPNLLLPAEKYKEQIVSLRLAHLSLLESCRPTDDNLSEQVLWSWLCKNILDTVSSGTESSSQKETEECKTEKRKAHQEALKEYQTNFIKDPRLLQLKSRFKDLTAPPGVSDLPFLVTSASSLSSSSITSSSPSCLIL